MPFCRSRAGVLAFFAMLMLFAFRPAVGTEMPGVFSERSPSGPLAEAPSVLADTGMAQRCARFAIRPARSKGGRPASIDDLLLVRDFGGVGLDMAAAPGFAVSPDGTRLAVQVRQAAPASNTYCQSLMVFDLRRPSAGPVTVMMGPELARNTITMYGMNGFPSGDAKALTPQWSPDGRWLAFVQRLGGFDSLFLARASGGQPVAVARLKANVGDFAWSPNGDALDYETDVFLREAQDRQAGEGITGYRYDDRFWMLAEPRPFVRGSLDVGRFRISVGPAGPVGQPATRPSTAASEPADRAWVEMDKEPAFAFRSRVHARVDGVAVPCVFAACENAPAAWWWARSRTVVFLRREGFGSSHTAVYVWRPGKGAPRRISDTDDALVGCKLASVELVCGHEASASPRDIVAIALPTGKTRLVLDLNPEWHEVKPARIIRLHWTNRFGIPAIGDLVLPEKVPAGAKVPLVVVQYETRGFLRGGTGDEYPVRPIAAAGFAVLSISRPLDYPIWLARSGRSFSQKEVMEAWIDRASVHDSLVKGIELAASRIALDRDHMAITGLSDGASTATYALIHARLFSLALLSTCCEDPVITTTSIGPAYEDMQRTYEYPVPWEAHADSWQQMSLAMNASHVCAEIQVQAADREARMALASITALRQAGMPIDMYLFPDEYHVKWQAAHRAAVYRRNLDKLLEWRSRPPVACFAPH
jgi:hypothetical protein